MVGMTAFGAFPLLPKVFSPSPFFLALFNQPKGLVAREALLLVITMNIPVCRLLT